MDNFRDTTDILLKRSSV